MSNLTGPEETANLGITPVCRHVQEETKPFHEASYIRIFPATTLQGNTLVLSFLMNQPVKAPFFLRWLNKAAQKGWIRFDQYSFLKRLAIALYLMSPGLWRTMKPVTHPWKALWALLTGKDTYCLYLPGQEPCVLRFSPLNFLNFIRLVQAGYPPRSMDPEKNTLVIEMAPRVFCTAHVAHTADLVILKELLIEQEYGASFPGFKVIDIGAYRGDTALFFCIYGAAEVIAAEPAPDNYAIAQENIQQSPYRDRIKLLPVAVSDTRGNLEFRLDPGHPYAYSLSHLHSSQENGSNTITVETWSFYDLIQYSGWKEVDLVKLDCEGAEYPILLHTSPEVLQKVRRWAIEYHGSLEPLKVRLQALGYEVKQLRDKGSIGILYAERLT